VGAWSAKEICDRAAEAEQARAAIYPQIDECLAYAMPWRRRFGGRQTFDHIFDSTALTATMRWAAKLQAGLTPPGVRWSSLKAGPMVPRAMRSDVNRALETPSELYAAVIDFSSYHLASLEVFSDLGVGTGALLVQEGDDNSIMDCTSAAAWQLAIENGPSNTAENVYWCKSYPAWILSRHWPQAVWPAEVQRKINERSTDKIEVLQATYYDPAAREWTLAIVVKGDGERAIAYDRRERTNPWIIPRYWTTAGDPWGRGPLMLELANIKTANKTVEMVLTAAALQLAPPLLVAHDGVINPDQIRLAPRALLPVSRTGGPMGRSIEPLDVGSRVELSQIVLDELRTGIKKNLLDEQLPPLSGAVRSASEIVQRAQDLQANSGAAFTRFNYEMGPQLVSRVLDILDRKRVAGIDFRRMRPDRYTLKVQMTSPLARTQALDDVQNTIQWAETSKAIGGEELWIHSAKAEELIPYLADKFGVSPNLVREAAERDALEQAAGQAVGAALAGGAQPADFATPALSPGA